MIVLSFTEQRNYCTKWIRVEVGDSCWQIANSYKISVDNLKSFNLGVNCDELWAGVQLCIATSTSKPKCTKTYKVAAADYCYKIWTDNGLSEVQFMQMNENLDCLKLALGQEVCTSIDGNPKVELRNMTTGEKDRSPLSSIEDEQSCYEFAKFETKSDTCESIAAAFNLNLATIESQFNCSNFKLNPILNCDRLREYRQVCAGRGSFESSKCIDSLRITPELDKCRKIVDITGLTTDQIKRLNPLIKCGLKLKHGTLVCINSLGMDTISAQQVVISSFKSLVPELHKEFKHFLMNPNQKNSEVMNKLMTSAIQKPEVNRRMKELYRIDVNFRTIIDNQHPPKRSVGCQFTFPSLKNGFLKGINAFTNPCWGGECSIPFGLVELAMEANLCLPVANIAHDVIHFCKTDGHDCSKANPDRLDELKVLADQSMGGKFKMCAIGHNWIQKLLDADAGLCWDIISADYHGFVGKLQIEATLQLILFKLMGGAVLKVHDLMYPRMCERSQLECEDYCKWRDWKNGKAYGYIEMRALAIFGWKGLKVFEETFSEPRALGCQAGKEAAVVLRIERTCKNPKDRQVWRCCWSGNDKCTFELMGHDKGFFFKPWKKTLFTCEFIDRDLHNGQKLGFDVYGGKSKNKGKKSFYYLVRNDGIYFGTEKYKEDTLVQAWDNPCEGVEEEKPNFVREEPNGKSSVPASGCGKRIVGYYTGWGEREITENQLKKLTHVIFAFVAMHPDGKVQFGPVSEDDAGPEAGVKAKRRFLDMRTKARNVNSGVYILFAIGGWDNSQYFASVAADPEKRKTFINSIVDFIVQYGIDGVDLDWEYPDMKGGDRNNHVALIRELRERFDRLQIEKQRKTRYLITLASAAGDWNIREGYDLAAILKHADFINVMTYDYYGAWRSKWGAFTGPPAPLYFGSLKGFSGKLNADFSMKYYACKSKSPSQLNMGVPFYGRYWRNVGAPIDESDDMWRTAQEVNGIFEGGYVGWRNLEREGWNKGAASWHDKTKTPYIVNAGARMFLGFENERSLREKVSYATNRNLGGLMIWALDLDDDADTLLSIVSSAQLCSGGSGNTITYKCNPIDEVRWWTPENSDETRQGQCGKSAPLINGYYPVCDPDDPGFSCCGAAGYCGSGKEYCECDTCVNYRKDPMAIVKKPTKPTRKVQWYLMSDPDGKRGRCGKDVPMLNGKVHLEEQV
uniref:Chitinase n=1 Tax=Caenorhabditis japonica TaxID=281687 RepID=A0A8R1HFL0_CAEJA